MRRFVLQRNEDVSGVSGTGIVAEGVVFTEGSAVLCWLGKLKSVAVYQNIDDLVAIHGHDGKTSVVFWDVLEQHPPGGGGASTWVDPFSYGFVSGKEE